ncbi:hypothetical protein SESBI_39588 [Sesbania bispinosa]|nr:hypothetical protein SESBI_39588 [Sesbania bispinosa]
MTSLTNWYGGSKIHHGFPYNQEWLGMCMSTPVSTVASESGFSAGGEMLDAF